jgi:hypothetical protein
MPFADHPVRRVQVGDGIRRATTDHTPSRPSSNCCGTAWSWSQVSRSWSGDGTGKSTLVQNRRGYLDAPQRYLRHILN